LGREAWAFGEAGILRNSSIVNSSTAILKRLSSKSSSRHIRASNPVRLQVTLRDMLRKAMVVSPHRATITPVSRAFIPTGRIIRVPHKRLLRQDLRL